LRSAESPLCAMIPTRPTTDLRQGTQRKSDFHIQVACVTLAKATHHREFAAKGRRSAAVRNKDVNSMYTDGARFKTHMFNTITCFNANAGKIAGAENWMEKLDSQLGIQPQVHSLNTLLLSCAKIGEFEKAEEWFSRCGMPALHPELIGLSPTTESYNIMIKMFIGAGELQRAE